MLRRGIPWAFVPTTVATLMVTAILTLSPTGGGRYPKQDADVVRSVLIAVKIACANRH